MRYAINPATGAQGSTVVGDLWYDGRRQVIKQKGEGVQAFEKYVYDSLGRQIRRYLAYGTTEADFSSGGGEALFRKGAGPLLPGTEHVPPPDPLEGPWPTGETANVRDPEDTKTTFKYDQAGRNIEVIENEGQSADEVVSEANTRHKRDSDGMALWDHDRNRAILLDCPQ